MGLVLKLHTSDIERLVPSLQKTLNILEEFMKSLDVFISPDFAKQYWWSWRGWRFIYCIVLSAVSMAVSVTGMIFRRQLFWWAVVDYHFFSMWCGAFAFLWTAGGGGSIWQAVLPNASASCDDNCRWVRAVGACTVMSACSWLLSFVFAVHYYRKNKNAV